MIEDANFVWMFIYLGCVSVNMDPVHGSNAGFVRQLKVVFDENPDYDYKDVSPETMEIIPVNFSTEHKSILSHLYFMINKEYLAIPEKYDKLII